MPPKQATTNPADKIKSSLTLELCSNATVTQLNDILFAPGALKPTKARAPAASTRKRTPAPDNATSSAASQLERHRLAVEVVNAAMRGLLEAAQAGVGPNSAPSPGLPTKKPTKPPAGTTKVLRSRSLNRNDKPAADLDSLDHLAICCSMATTFLQSLEAVKGIPESKPLQTENTRSILATKLMQLGKYKFALAEWKKLKRRLEELVQADTGVESSAVTDGDSAPAKTARKGSTASIKTAASKESTAEGEDVDQEGFSRVLEFPQPPPSSPVLPLVIVCQLGILRCVAGLKRPDMVEAMLPSFKSPQHNPLSTIKLLAQHDPTKASTYAASLSQIISSIIPAITPAVDSVALDPKISCSPSTALLLQCTSLESIAFQRTVVKVANPKIRSIWEYLLPHVQTYIRRTQNFDATKKRDRYAIIREISHRLQKVLGEAKLPLDILKSLSCTSAEANLGKEAIRWTEEWLNELSTCGTASDAALIVLCKVRLAILELRRWRFGQSEPKEVEDLDINMLEQKVQDATAGMDSVAKGRKPDLEFLLQEVGLFRRTTFPLLAGVSEETITRLFKADDPNSLSSQKERLRVLGEDSIRSVLLFCRKYMGMGISSNENSRIKTIIIPGMEAMLAACWRGFDINRSDAWERMEKLLKDCWSAMKACESELADEGAVSFYEKVSNVYWRVHLIYRSSPGHDQNAVRALRRSIATMDGRPAAEIANSQIAKKWERLGTIFITARDYNKAEDAFLSCLDASAKTGIFAELGNLASVKETVYTISSNVEYSWLGRVLASLIRIATKKKDDTAQALGFHHKGLSVAARGILLEWSFHLALDDMSDGGSVLRAIGERLIDVYELEDMPIRRTRVIASLLALTVDQAGLLDIDYVQSLGEDVLDWAKTTDSFNTQLEDDQQLVSQKDDALARCKIGLALCYWKQGKPRSELATQALLLWSGIFMRGDWEACVERVTDIEGLKRRLEMMSEFFEMKDEVELQVSTLNVLLRIRELEVPVDHDAIVNIHASLGLIYHRLGFSGKAGISLLKGQALIKEFGSSISTQTQLRWNLSYTEYLVAIGNADKGLSVLKAAGELLEGDQEFVDSRKMNDRRTNKIRTNTMIANAAYITSLIALQKGQTEDALFQVHRCIRLYSRVWIGLKHRNTEQQKPEDSLADAVKDLSLASKPDPMSLDTLNLPNLWSLVSGMTLGYLQAVAVYRHVGMIREALYYAEKAQKVVEAVDAKPAIARILVITGDLKVRSGKPEDGRECFKQALETSNGGQVAVQCQVALGHLQRTLGDLEGEIEAYHNAQAELDKLTASTAILNYGRLGEPDELNLAEGLSKLEIAEADVPAEPVKKTTRSRTPTRTPSKAPKKTPTKSPARGRARSLKSAPAKPVEAPAKKPVSLLSAAQAECPVLLKQSGNIKRLIAENLSVRQEWKEAVVILQDAANLPAGEEEIIRQHLVEARNLFHQALSLVSTDMVLSGLREATISLPSIRTETETDDADILASPVKKSTRKAPAKSTKTKTSFIEVLEQARDRIYTIQGRIVKYGSVGIIHQSASLLADITLLLSAMSLPKGVSTDHPLFPSYSIEQRSSLIAHHESLAVNVEKSVSATKETLQWPEFSIHPATTIPFEFSNYQSEYIDIIPSNWTVVSIACSPDKNELYITRFHAGEEQLTVRLPFSRHNLRDEYTEPYSHEEGLTDLRDIMERANESSHAAKDMVEKAARSKWWKERKNLDAFLGEFLAQIEKLWLGGFRGLFSPIQSKPSAFAKFTASFDKIMARHVPSRKKKKANRVEIDPRILGLFVALGDPDQEMDLQLHDLIYFVIDILQYHGEGNAFDELDLDAMTVELLDALKFYHEDAAPAAPPPDSHIILILDKTVQAIPWESIPCLRPHPVSRLPSLLALHDRILAMNPTTPPAAPPGHYISPTSGGYILNPACDLKNTQTLFHPHLSTLPSTWSAISQRIPTESEFAAILAEKDILLYFGHGSGSQYIPAKTIRRLERCALSCLMGCSSGALKDAGEFEPYGPAGNYLIAGAPAVVATLWDVTDRDIDAFALEMVEGWGLMRAASRKGKGKAGEKGGGKSLVEAVRSGREACVLRYLNGAAAVVYGIPAYVD